MIEDTISVSRNSFSDRLLAEAVRLLRVIAENTKPLVGVEIFGTLHETAHVDREEFERLVAKNDSNERMIRDLCKGLDKRDRPIVPLASSDALSMALTWLYEHPHLLLSADDGKHQWEILRVVAEQLSHVAYGVGIVEVVHNAKFAIDNAGHGDARSR